MSVSEVGLGTWQLGGGDWGPIDDDTALDTLHAAADSGVTLFDTADIYGGGESERRLGVFLAQRADRRQFLVATKFGRAGEPGGAANLQYDVMKRHMAGSCKRLGVEQLWLVQGHCLATEALESGEVFDNLRRLQGEGLIAHWGMSVESVEQAQLCLQQQGLTSLQVIFNVFRQKLIGELFELAKQKQVALIVRLPLASGLLGGKLTRSSRFSPSDHRSYNKDGAVFNAGETFAGLPFEAGLDLVEALRPEVPVGTPMAVWALRYCLDFDAVTSVIPGARNAEQARGNAAASVAEPLSAESHARLQQLYSARVAELIRGSY
jgi:aryl-alcohol dehydrogenase-like predicted oxidoreductase